MTDVLTPRTEVVAVSEKHDQQIIASVFLESGYSRLPVYRKTIDNIVGVINHKDFYNYVYQTDKTIECIIKPVMITVPTMKISKLLKQLQSTKSHLAVITDEYGRTMGIVTLEDIVEELVGDIWDEHDEIIEEFTKISEKIGRAHV